MLASYDAEAVILLNAARPPWMEPLAAIPFGVMWEPQACSIWEALAPINPGMNVHCTFIEADELTTGWLAQAWGTQVEYDQEGDTWRVTLPLALAELSSDYERFGGPVPEWALEDDEQLVSA